MTGLLPLWLALVATTTTSSAAPPAPSVELVTLAPGEALYALWGHTAVRVIERAPTRDVAYDFGRVDVSEEAWLGMLTGRLEAEVIATPYHRLAAIYRAERRSVVRRPLALRPEEARRLADALAASAAAPNPRYRYHHFDDNCATRVAGAVDAALDGALSTRTSSSASTTLRALALEPLRRESLLYVVVDTLLSGAVDRPIPRWRLTFLPAGIDEVFDSLDHPEGAPLAAPPIVDYIGEDAQRRGRWTWPWVKVYLLFVTPLLGLFLRFRRLAAAVWCGVAGVSGLLILAGWLATGYDFLAHNYNALVLPMTHLAAFGALVSPRALDRRAVRAALRAYALAHLAVLGLLIAARVAHLLPQAIDPVLGLALGPAVAMVVRPVRAAS